MTHSVGGNDEEKDITRIFSPPFSSAKSIFQRMAMICTGALFLAWPALYNGFPLLYPDSMTYLGDGRLVARAVFLHQMSEYYGIRSFFYSLGILPWHWNVTPWPVVALQTLLTAYVLWLVVVSLSVNSPNLQSTTLRSISPRQMVLRYLALIALLSLFTSVSWYSSLIMPDILGPLTYLCFYLLVFARDDLSRFDHVAVFLIAVWGITSHATHLMLAAGLCALLFLLRLLPLPILQVRWNALGEIALTVVLAAGAQLALHGYLYGKPSLNGDRPPFLTARVIADGPGRWYLQQHCNELKFAICDHLNNLPDDPDNFLWGPDGIWQTADDDYAQRLSQEEMPFVKATLRAYPRQELAKVASAFWNQLTLFGLYDLDGSDWIVEEMDSVLPGSKPYYLRSKEGRNDLPLEFFTSMQQWVVIGSIVIGFSLTIVGLKSSAFRANASQLLGLSVVIVSTVIANALVTGPLSLVEDRFEARIIWLLPLLTGLLFFAVLDRRAETQSLS